MIANKKEFGFGLGLMIGFWALFIIFMSPVFAGQNLLDYMDNLYNSISKASSYYIPKAAEKAKSYEGHDIKATIKASDDEQAKRMAVLLTGAANAGVSVEGSSVKVTGDIGRILSSMVADSESLYNNRGAEVSARHGGMDARQALYDWYSIGKSLQKTYEKENDGKGYNTVYAVMTKAVEPAYNYFGIEARSIRDNIVTVAASLAGYVVYTLWFGFAILFMFEGWGLKLEH